MITRRRLTPALHRKHSLVHNAWLVQAQLVLAVLLHLALRRGVELIEALLLFRHRPVRRIDPLTGLGWQRIALFLNVDILL